MPNKYGPKAHHKIAKVMREYKRGDLKSSSGHRVKSRAQAVAIGISEAKQAGYKVPNQKQARAAKHQHRG